MTDLHRRKALTLSEQGARDWEAFVKLDPSNQIAWHNLGVTRGRKSYALGGLGLVRKSQEAMRAALAVEPHTEPSAMIGAMLGFTEGYLAGSEADSGNRQTAEATLSENRRHIQLSVRDLKADSFGRSFLPEYLGWYAVPVPGAWYGPYGLARAAGDYEALRTQARASLGRIEQIKPANPQQELAKNRLLYVAYRTLADASYNLKDYAAADAAIKQSIEAQRAIPKRTLFDERDANESLMLAAMIAARLEKYSEAQKIIEPVLKFNRELYARKDNDDLTQHAEFAQALYASALAAPGQKTAQLTQAATIIDGLPPEMRSLKSVAIWRERIAEEQKKRH
jgi:tetratricopeptide (TPR) repeat protein